MWSARHAQGRPTVRALTIMPFEDAPLFEERDVRAGFALDSGPVRQAVRGMLLTDAGTYPEEGRRAALSEPISVAGSHDERVRSA